MLFAKAEPQELFRGHGKEFVDAVCSRDVNGTVILSHLFEGGVSCASLFYEELKFSDRLAKSAPKETQLDMTAEDIENEHLYGKRSRNASSSLPASATSSEDEKCGSMYLVVSDSQSAVVIFNLDSLRVILASKSVRRQEALLISCVGADNDLEFEKHKKHVREIRVHRMQQIDRKHDALSRLCLVAMFEAGDFGLYRATETISGCIAGFLKVEYASAIRKRKAKMKLRRTIWNEPAANDAVEFEDSNMYSMTRVDSINGYSGLVISGPRPVFVSASAGYPFAIPITFPELPCIFK